MGGDQSDYKDETTTRAVDLTTVKIHLQSVLSTVGGKYMYNLWDLVDNDIFTLKFGKVCMDYLKPSGLRTIT